MNEDDFVKLLQKIPALFNPLRILVAAVNAYGVVKTALNECGTVAFAGTYYQRLSGIYFIDVVKDITAIAVFEIPYLKFTVRHCA